MATMVALVETDDFDFSLGATAVRSLSRLGVTNLVLLRDRGAVAVVLEGWAFEPAVSADAALLALALADGRARALHPFGEMAISTTQPEGG